MRGLGGFSGCAQLVVGREPSGGTKFARKRERSLKGATGVRKTMVSLPEFLDFTLDGKDCCSAKLKVGPSTQAVSGRSPHTSPARWFPKCTLTP